MCGIVGYYTKKYPSLSQMKYLEEALFFDTVRGSCGTGVAAVDKEGSKYEIIKKAMPAPDFLQTPKWEAFKKESHRYNMFIGHNRAATRGEANDGNSHPFYAGPDILLKNQENHYKQEIVLVHNGTLNDFRGLSPKGFFHDVDSAHIAAGMAWKGEKETLESLNGWFVLIWANLTKKTFNIARSEARDIDITFSKEKDCIYFGSDSLLLAPALSRANLETNGKFVSPKAYEWFSWDLASKTFDDYKVESIKKYVAPPTIHTNGGGGAGISDIGWNRGKGRRHFGNPYGGGSLHLPPSTHFQGRKTDAEELESLGVDQYEELTFMVTGWEPFSLNSNPASGKLFGETYSSPEQSAIPIVAYTVSKDDYESIFKHKAVQYSCKGTAIRVDNVTEKKGLKHIVVTPNLTDAKLAVSLYNVEEVSRELEEVTSKPTGATTSIGAAIKAARMQGGSSYDEAEIAERVVIPEAKVHLMQLPGPRGDLVGMSEWRVLVQDGCAQCSTSIYPRMAKGLMWAGEYNRDPICPACAEQIYAQTTVQRLPDNATNKNLAPLLN
jgi:predicted glutamine amidotransferase